MADYSNLTPERVVDLINRDIEFQTAFIAANNFPAVQSNLATLGVNVTTDEDAVDVLLNMFKTGVIEQFAYTVNVPYNDAGGEPWTQGYSQILNQQPRINVEQALPAVKRFADSRPELPQQRVFDWGLALGGLGTIGNVICGFSKDCEFPPAPDDETLQAQAAAQAAAANAELEQKKLEAEAAAKKQQTTWLIIGGVVVLGLIVAVAVVLSRRSKTKAAAA